MDSLVTLFFKPTNFTKASYAMVKYKNGNYLRHNIAISEAASSSIIKVEVKPLESSEENLNLSQDALNIRNVVEINFCNDQGFSVYHTFI